MPEQLNFSATVEIQAAEAGKAPRVSILAYGGGEMVPNGFSTPLVIDLASLKFSGQVPLLADHNDSLEGIAGHGTAGVRNHQLFVDGMLTGSTEAGGRILSLSREGFKFQASVGVQPGQYGRVQAGGKIAINGRTLTAGERGLLIVRGGVLREVSILSLGADASTAVSVAAKGNTMSEPIIEPVADDPVSLERIRVSKVAKIAAKHPAILERAVSEGWDETKTELETLRASRGSAPLPQSSGGPRRDASTARILAAATLSHMGRESAGEKEYGADTMQRARDLRATSLLDLCRCALTMEGQPVPSGRNELVRAAVSTFSLPVALGSAAEKVLLDAYMDSPATWRAFVNVRSVRNFKTNYAVRPTALGSLVAVAAGGELEHTTIGEDTYQFAADTFGRMLGVDRRDIINDDLGLFDTNAQAFGRSAARSLADKIYSVLLANTGNFFHANNANYDDGTDSALSTTSLGVAIAAMISQRDAAGNDLDIRPRTLLVPPSLAETGKTVLQSEYIQRSATDSGPTGNSLRGAVSLEVEPRLANSDKFSGTSEVGWYLFASPNDAALIAAFLDGRQAPVVEFFGLESDPARLAVTWRVYFDYGAAFGDPKAGYLAKGSS